MARRGLTIEAMKFGILPENLFERVALMAGKVPVPAVDVLYGMLKSRVVMAAVTLGIFELLSGGPATADEIARRLQLDSRSLELTLRTLVVCDYLTFRDGRYELSRLARRTMLRDAPQSFVGFVEWNYTQWDMIEHLEELLKTGRGIDFHEKLSDPVAWAHYQRAMMETSKQDAPQLAKRVPVRRGATKLLDVAGSHGVLGAAICRRHPPMRSLVLDLPQAIEHARALAVEAGVSDIVEHRAGDLLDDELGTGFDVVLLANILHHFTEQQNANILRRVYAATSDGGTVAVWELEAPRRNTPATAGDAVALFFRLTSTAGAYHGDAHAQWLRDAGFGDVRIQRPALSPGNVLVTARK